MTNLQQMIDYYKESEQLCIRKMNENCSEYFAHQAIRYSKIIDALNVIKSEGIFE